MAVEPARHTTVPGAFSGSSLRADFPVFDTLTRQGKRLVFLDAAASAPKPRVVIDAVADAYAHHYANVHRGIYELSEDATQRFEGARRKVAGFINAPSEREIATERVFDAPRDRVFAAYTDPGLIPEWWGPRGTTTIVDQMEVRPGGKWRFVHRDEDGNETGFRGTYREISPPERIVQTFEWEGMPGHVLVETAIFEDLGEQTRVKTTSLFHTPEERDGMLASGMEAGLTETHERLDELLAKVASG